jgi:hypothetical protein
VYVIDVYADLQVNGVLYHEVTHVWQWDGQGNANVGLMEGIADYVQLKAGFSLGGSLKPGEGDRWDQGYDVTAYFLDYGESLMPGFVAQLNAKMKDGYSDDFFAQILGKSVQQLWIDYKAKYSTTGMNKDADGRTLRRRPNVGAAVGVGGLQESSPKHPSA